MSLFFFCRITLMRSLFIRHDERYGARDMQLIPQLIYETYETKFRNVFETYLQSRLFDEPVKYHG